ncbi:tyrosine-type recombinase/integrase [Rhodospirillum sp. A1_3_36]|uniref:tyrosine-type recombinase/integrase n=1 Tax=Rhodospirillum sp. A1_3_36 TaxID=3391666 RepID=UPI0039A6A6C1
MPKLTNPVVKSAAPASSGKRLYLWDTEVKGFGLCVTPTGAKSFVTQYRNASGQTKRMVLGKPGALTTEQARDMARKVLWLAHNGGDPLEERREERRAVTIGGLLDQYLESETFMRKAPSTKGIDRGRVSRHLKPLMGTKVANKVRPKDVDTLYAKIRDGATAATEKSGKARGVARVTGGEGTAKKAVTLLSAAYVWGIKNGIVESNPCKGVSLAPDGRREIIIDDREGYARLFKTIDLMENLKEVRHAVADAVRVIALTGARRGEIAGLRWEHVDLKQGIITLPANGHKSGRKTGEARVIGLPALAQAVIARQPLGGAGDYVFKAMKGTGVISLSEPWRRIRKAAGLPVGLGLHGLRHSLASHLAMSGAGASEIMAALGHRQLSTSQRYVHWSQDRRQSLAEKAASLVFGVEEGGGEVVDMRTNERIDRKGG